MKAIHKITNWKIKSSIVEGIWELWTERGGTWYLHDTSENHVRLYQQALRF